MLSSEDYFVFGLIFVASPFLVYTIETLFSMDLSPIAHFSSLIGTVGVLFLGASIIR